MENMPESSEQKTFSYQDVSDACDDYQKASAWYRRPFMPRVATAAAIGEDGSWKAVLLIEKERHEKRVRKLAEKCINDVPVDVRVMGVAEAI